ncbi:MAG: Rrf2 family transcriptional regulator [Flavobacteriales bacterium]|nr:Rrf2 family transcriptional regulator [Flavobacteriales bacterium]
MQLDTSFSTAIHICVYLEKAGKKLVNSNELAASIGTNPVVVRRIVSRLKEFGIIKVKVGLGGGYVLGRTAGNISLWDIYLAMRKDNPFKLRVGNSEDALAASLPAALEETLADTEYAMKKPLGNTTVRQVASKIDL